MPLYTLGRCTLLYVPAGRHLRAGLSSAVHAGMCRFDRRIREARDPSEKPPKRVNNGGFSHKEASLRGYTLGF